LAANIANIGGGEVSSFRHSPDHDISVGKDTAYLTVVEDETSPILTSRIARAASATKEATGIEIGSGVITSRMLCTMQVSS
jgi:hypothetical protein